MPEEDDDQLVPPLKVMRKRLNGVYSAGGFRAPTRRYVLIVALLVGLASVPTLAAITARPLDESGTGGAMDSPLLPPLSAGPVAPGSEEPGSVEPGPSGDSTGSGPVPGPTQGPTMAPAPIQGQAGTREPNHPQKPQNGNVGTGSGTQPHRISPAKPKSKPQQPSRPGGTASKPSEPRKPSQPRKPDWSEAGTSGAGSDSSGSDGSDSEQPDQSGGSDQSGSDGSQWDGPDGSGASHHSGADDQGADQRNDQRGDRADDGSWSGDGQQDSEGSADAGSEDPGDSGDRHCEESQHRERQHVARHRRSRVFFPSFVKHRSASPARSSIRRSEVAESPRNLRQARTAERTHNNHGNRYPAGEQTGARSYRGSHRSERRHRADDQRNSRVGHHHTADHHDQPSRW